MLYTKAFQAALAAALLLLGSISAPVRADIIQPGDPEWTPLAPSADSLIVYVSSSQGNDANSGLSPQEAKKTIAAGKALLRDGFPDWLLLRCGDVWFEAVGDLPLSGRSAQERMVISSYDTGDRPLLLTGTATGLFAYAPRIDNLAVVGLHMRAHKWFGNGIEQPSGVYVLGTGDGLLVEDCKFENFAVSVSVLGQAGKRRDTKIRRNIMIDPLRTNPNSGSVNFFATDYENGLVIDGNVMMLTDLAEARGARMTHNVYLVDSQGTDSIVRNNIAYNGGRMNFSVRSGGEVEKNLSIGGAVSIAFGYNLSPTLSSGSVHGNVVTRSRDNSNGQPLGIAFYINRVTDARLYNNIVTGNTNGTNPLAFYMQEHDSGIEIYNNIVYKWARANASQATSLIEVLPPATGQVNVYANQFQQPVASTLINIGSSSPGLGAFWTSGNRYFSGSSNSSWFFANGQFLSPSAWVQTTGENNATFERIGYSDPLRDVPVYNAWLGGPATVSGFLAEAAKQSRVNWRPAYTAQAVIDFIRQGFTETGSQACRADIDRNGGIDGRDQELFFSLYQRGEPAADLDRNGVLTASDLVGFWSSFNTSCADQ